MSDTLRDTRRGEPVRAQLERALGVALSATAALIAITCGSRGTLEHGPIAPLVLSAAGAGGGSVGGGGAPSSGAVAPLGVATAAETAHSSAEAGVGSGNVLGRFFRDLAGLEAGTRREMVRIFWLGDSHTAADYLTGALRSRLEKRFGVGGPGFARIGLKPYRHSQIRWACDGPWKIEPVPPPRRTLFDDGVFGLGGMRAAPDGAPAQASFELSPGSARGQLHWQLWFSLKEGSSFRLTVASVSQVITQASQVPELPGAGFASLALESAATDKLELLTLGGSPRFYGLTVEGSEPGVVLDAVGIDGARLATALAWSETSFEAALRTRTPSLVALAFGTNEAFDADKIEKYRSHYRDALARVRIAAPNADCLIVGPPDAVAVGGGSEPRVTEIDVLQRSVATELGCGFVSQLQIMGGAGGFSRWARQTPPLARGDRLHLSAKGYETMANAIADELLAKYDNRAH
ncbi:MAG TPA: GDSL-type esterase/lipase family protein [Polyangiaceae bacterium]|nr:GDSL-type esterase/lipase family protein [Polyangiaceae bacterium]